MSLHLSSIPHRTIYNALEKLYDGWTIPEGIDEKGLAAVDEHYRKISQKYSYDIPTPEYMINLLGYQYLGQDKVENAIEVFKENVVRFPDSANVYDSLGETYEKNEQLELAKENYTKACELVTEDDPNYDIFNDNLDRIKELLK